MAYVNDQNPIIHDLLLQVAFEPIKTALKRDLRAWEDIRLKRSEAGRKAMFNRYNKDILTNPNTVKQSLTNLTVNDTVSVNVNDNVTVSVKEKKKKKEIIVLKNKLILPYDSVEFVEAWNNLLSTKKWKNKSNVALEASTKKLAKYSEADGIEMINNSITGEWQGLFELKKSFSAEKKSTHLSFIENTLKNNEALNKKYSQDDTTGK